MVREEVTVVGEEGTEAVEEEAADAVEAEEEEIELLCPDDEDTVLARLGMAVP